MVLLLDLWDHLSGDGQGRGRYVSGSEELLEALQYPQLRSTARAAACLACRCRSIASHRVSLTSNVHRWVQGLAPRPAPETLCLENTVRSDLMSPGGSDPLPAQPLSLPKRPRHMDGFSSEDAPCKLQPGKNRPSTAGQHAG